MIVAGRILFTNDAQPFSGAVAKVVVEDTTYADAPAVRVAEWTRTDVAYPRDADGIPFEITVAQDPPPNARYTLRGIIDADGDGRLGRGDYYSKESIRVLPGQTTIDVRVSRVGA